jgi:AraC-like DNA-binding protein
MRGGKPYEIFSGGPEPDHLTMDQLNDNEIFDPVSEVLRAVRIRSTILCRSALAAPWGFGIVGHGKPVFHLITRGSCWLDVEGEDAQLPLGAGDLVLLPTGRRHRLRDEPHTPVPELEDILGANPLDRHLRLRLGDGDATTTMLCGWFDLNSAFGHPLLGALPAQITIRGGEGRPAPWVAATCDLLAAELESDSPGALEVISRLADAMLAQVLRLAVVDLLTINGSAPSGQGDAAIAAAIEQIHRRPEHPWTVAELAANVALSRSAFSARFSRRLGESPKRYLTRTRLAYAASLLDDTDASLAKIALRVGYGSEFSFGKAFKRTFGVAPGAYRGLERAAPDHELVGLS